MGQQESLEINTNENTNENINKFEAIQENKTEKINNLNLNPNPNETEILNEQNEISNIIEDVYIICNLKKNSFHQLSQLKGVHNIIQEK